MFFSLKFWRAEVRKSECWQGYGSPGGSKGESFLAFSCFYKRLHSLAHSPFLHLQGQQYWVLSLTSVFIITPSVTLTLLAPFIMILVIPSGPRCLVSITRFLIEGHLQSPFGCIKPPAQEFWELWCWHFWYHCATSHRDDHAHFEGCEGGGFMTHGLLICWDTFS